MTSETILFAKGDRVKTHPATGAWMQGDRYGNVVHVAKSRKRVGSYTVHVLMDTSNRVRKFSQSLLEAV